MDKYEIAVLADDYHTKKMRRDTLAMMNSPNNPEERRKSAIEYHIADAECFQAYLALERAKLKIETK